MCLKYTIEDLFAVPENTKKVNNKRRAYDVKISGNKTGHQRPSVRFGFLNKANEVYSHFNYIKISRIDVCKDRIYFKPLYEKEDRVTYKIIKSLNVNGEIASCYCTLTAPEDLEKSYRMNWIGQTFNLQFDEEFELYYIEKAKN